MQATAPGSRSEPHAGHFVGVDGAAAGLVATPEPRLRLGVEPRLTLADDGGAEDPGTTNGFLQPGQRNVLPAEPSGSCIALLQLGQLMIRAMEIVPKPLS